MTRSPVPESVPLGTRRRILDTALTLIDQRGAVAVSTEDIRSTARVSVGSLYHHFPGGKPAVIADLFDECLRQYQSEAVAVLHASAGHEPGIRAMIKHFLCWTETHPARSRALLRFELDPPELVRPDTIAATQAFFASVGQWLAEHRPPQAATLPLPALLALWVGPAKEYARGWLVRRFSQPPTQLNEALAEAAWQTLRGLSATSPQPPHDPLRTRP